MEDQKIKEHADKHEATDTHLHTHNSKKRDIIIICWLPVHQKLSCTKVHTTITRTLKQTWHHKAKLEPPWAQFSQPNGRSNHLLVVVDEQSRWRLGVKCVARPWLLANSSSLPLTIMSRPWRCQKCRCRRKSTSQPLQLGVITVDSLARVTQITSPVSFPPSFCKVEKSKKRFPGDVDCESVRAEVGMLALKWSYDKRMQKFDQSWIKCPGAREWWHSGVGQKGHSLIV